MALQKKFTRVDYDRFEADLLQVLKKEPSHRLDFDGKMVFRSRRHDCLLAATDVFWDEDTGDIVLVGAFRSGAPVYDETKPFPVMKERVAVPLKECFDDLKESSGMEMRLLGKARKAVIDRYMGEKMNWLDSRGLVRSGVLDLKALGIGEFPMDTTKVAAVMRGEDGQLSTVCYDSLSPGYEFPLSKMTLQQIQGLGLEMDRVIDALGRASDVYSAKMRELEPASMSYSDRDRARHRDAALMAVYDAGYSLDICSAVAGTYAQSDVFDRSKHRPAEIMAAVKGFRTSGCLAVPERGKGQSW